MMTEGGLCAPCGDKGNGFSALLMTIEEIDGLLRALLIAGVNKAGMKALI